MKQTHTQERGVHSEYLGRGIPREVHSLREYIGRGRGGSQPQGIHREGEGRFTASGNT
jgi:hypothetical protein